MSSRRANIWNPKNYGTICDIEAHHDLTTTRLLTEALSYIPSFVYFLCLRLNEMVPPTHNHIGRCAQRIIRPKVSDAGVSDDATPTSNRHFPWSRIVHICYWSASARLTPNFWKLRRLTPKENQSGCQTFPSSPMPQEDRTRSAGRSGLKACRTKQHHHLGLAEPHYHTISHLDSRPSAS